MVTLTRAACLASLVRAWLPPAWSQPGPQGFRRVGPGGPGSLARPGNTGSFSNVPVSLPVPGFCPHGIAVSGACVTKLALSFATVRRSRTLRGERQPTPPLGTPPSGAPRFSQGRWLLCRRSSLHPGEGPGSDVPGAVFPE